MPIEMFPCLLKISLVLAKPNTTLEYVIYISEENRRLEVFSGVKEGKIRKGNIKKKLDCCFMQFYYLRFMKREEFSKYKA